LTNFKPIWYNTRKGGNVFRELEVRRGLKEIKPILCIPTIYIGKAFVCGGYVRYCLSPRNNPVKAQDVDIYCRDETAYQELTSYFQSEGFTPRHDNPIALTYLKLNDFKWGSVPVIQLIKPIKQGAIVASGTVEEILDNFDFTVIRCALKPKYQYSTERKTIDIDWIGLVDTDFEQDETNKNLKIKKIHCPVSSLLRFMKYGKKGYNARPMQILALFADWDNRTQEYRDNLFNKLDIVTGGDTLTQKEIDELEALMRID